MGFAIGASCFRSSTEAEVAYCQSVAGTTSQGVVSCEAPTITGQVLEYTLNVDDAAGRTSRAVSVQLQDCTPFDYAEVEPLLWTWVAAAILIIAVRRLARMFNTRETA